MDQLLTFLAGHANYLAYIVIMMVGLWAMIVKRNLMKKIIGLGIFQTSIMLFYVSIGAKEDASIPILTKESIRLGIEVSDYVNPLPHVLMLTAIVVSVATLGVALALLQQVFDRYETIEEDEILDQIRRS